MSAELGVAVDVMTDPSAGVRAADVVTCATTATEPIVFGRDLAYCRPPVIS